MPYHRPRLRRSGRAAFLRWHRRRPPPSKSAWAWRPPLAWAWAGSWPCFPPCPTCACCLPSTHKRDTKTGEWEGERVPRQTTRGGGADNAVNIIIPLFRFSPPFPPTALEPGPWAEAPSSSTQPCPTSSWVLTLAAEAVAAADHHQDPWREAAAQRAAHSVLPRPRHRYHRHHRRRGLCPSSSSSSSSFSSSLPRRRPRRPCPSSSSSFSSFSSKHRDGRECRLCLRVG